MLSDQHDKAIPIACEPVGNSDGSVMYQIRVRSHLHSGWTEWFDGLSITLEENGDMLLTGPVVDQAALHGLLRKVRDLGMTLISVNPVQFNESQLERERER